MLFLERLAEQKIQEAMERGDFDNLPGKGQPIPEEPELSQVPEALRMAFRLLKNAGYLPEEVLLMRSIEELAAQIETGDEAARNEGQRRLQFALLRLGSSRFGSPELMERYCRQLADKFGRTAPHPTKCQNTTPA